MQPSNMLAHSVYVISLNPLDFYVWGHPKTSVYSGPVVNEETLDQCIFYACQIIHNCPGTFERVRQSMIRCVHACLDQMEDILSIGCEL
jgi:hypothetical protein